MPGAAPPLDATVEVVTPENIAFTYRVAGPFRRLPAFILDLIVRLAIFWVLVWLAPFVIAVTGLVYLAVLLILWFVLDWFYGSLFETYMNGQTPGKYAFGLRVLSIDGQPINGIQAVMRNILRYVDLMPLLSLQTFGPWWEFLLEQPAPPVYIFPTAMLGLVVMSLNGRFQRLGDIVCGTMVVVVERQWFAGVARIDDPRVAQLAEYLPVDYRVSRSLARALAAYLDRRRFFSPARQQEIARHLAEPLRERWGLWPDTSPDLLLCALYYRAFISDRAEQEGEPTQAAAGANPFQKPSAGVEPTNSLDQFFGGGLRR